VRTGLGLCSTNLHGERHHFRRTIPASYTIMHHASKQRPSTVTPSWWTLRYPNIALYSTTSLYTYKDSKPLYIH
jgi:hypothetical protein